MVFIEVSFLRFLLKFFVENFTHSLYICLDVFWNFWIWRFIYLSATWKNETSPYDEIKRHLMTKMSHYDICLFQANTNCIIIYQCHKTQLRLRWIHSHWNEKFAMWRSGAKIVNKRRLKRLLPIRAHWCENPTSHLIVTEEFWSYWIQSNLVFSESLRSSNQI